MLGVKYEIANVHSKIEIFNLTYLFSQNINQYFL